MTPFFSHNNFTLYHGDCRHIMPNLGCMADMIFADPPYFLSNDGFTVQAGEIVSVNKGSWDKLSADETVHSFNQSWLAEARGVLKPNGTIWVCGTFHNIFPIAQILSDLDFKILNCVVWNKTNPPPNFTKRYFTHSSEFLIWARKEKKVPHTFNYEIMKQINDGKQMQDVWRMPAISRSEKKFGKHPTQKPLHLLNRIIQASTNPGDLILDPFTGSSTTGIAAHLLNRDYIGVDCNVSYLGLSIARFNGMQS